MLLVTLHGGKPKSGNPKLNTRLNNVLAFDKQGQKVTSSVLKHANRVVLSELRGIYLVGKHLYVVNANRTQNSVLCYQGSGVKYSLKAKLVSRKNCPAIVHPFDLAFDDKDHCYLSSQDSNVVTRLKLQNKGRKAKPARTATALPKDGKFAPGTFVASSVKLKPPSTPVPLPAGLDYSGRGVKKHSVRGIAWAKGALYVADQPAQCIKVYDRHGKFLGQSNPAGTPVHLLVRKGQLYVSGDNHVRVGKLPNPPGNFTLAIIESIKVKNSGGMAFSRSGNLYVASRTQNSIHKFDRQFNRMKFQCKTPGNPEFLLHV